MCGIVGFFDRKNTTTQRTLEAMMASLRHRGPDAEGFYLDQIESSQVGLGHRRLSVIDISDHANQPMSFDYLTIVYNGEVYNFKEIRDKLIKENYFFTTNGDTEVILKAFHKWGVQSINLFRGMFSFCIVDKKNKKSYLVRDRVGVKPLYFYQNHSIFLFSSEMKAFYAHPLFKKSISEKSLQFYLHYGYMGQDQAIFDRTQKVKPGHYIEYDFLKNEWSERSYWNLTDFYHAPKFDFNETQSIQQLHELLIDSFSLRMVSDVPVGVFLSGGIDSSLIAAILQKNSSEKLNTFTIGFGNKNFDESHHARKIAEHLGTEHHEKMCSSNEAEKIIEQLPLIYDEPFADISAIPTTLLAEFTKQKVTVALSGDGGDELFCGYSSYLLNQNRFNKIANLPFKKLLGKILNKIPDPFMALYHTHYDIYNRYLKFKSVLSNEQLEEKYHSILHTFTQYDMNKLMLNNQHPILFSDSFSNLNTLERMMIIDFKQYLPDDILVKVDRATMYYSLEGREPLLDHKILEFAAQLPIHLKQNKWILKQILAQYIPNAYFERKKHGFGVPVNQWLRTELKYLLDKYLDPGKIKTQGLFNPNYIAKLKKSFLHSKTNDNRIWTLLVFQLWHEQHAGTHF